jgi:hypothetical protein
MSRSTQQIRNVVREWYDVSWMPLVLQTREEEIEEFEKDHDYIPPEMWQFVNHPQRQVFRWLRDPCCVDIVVWNPASASYRMVQDLCFKDAYPGDAEWHKAILTIVKDPQLEVWIVTHALDDLPSIHA